MTLKLRIRDVSLDHDGRSFRIEISPSSPSSPQGTIAGTVTPPMNVVRYHLVIDEQPPETWYKDEGGRDKSISLKYKLVNSHGEVVTDRDMPLSLSLIYGENKNTDPTRTRARIQDRIEDRIEVKNQQILRILSQNPPSLKNGIGSVNLRVEEVSKNHQKQPFSFLLSPDISFAPSNLDVAPIASDAVAVRSKRNKRNRKRESDNPRVKDVRLGNYPSSLPNFPSSGGLREPIDSKTISLLQTIPVIGSHLQGMASWMNYAYSTLSQLEFQHVGYEHDPNGGGPNMNCPLYRCPGCWVYRDTKSQSNHRDDCPVRKLIDSFEKKNRHEVTFVAKRGDSKLISRSGGGGNGQGGSGLGGIGSSSAPLSRDGDNSMMDDDYSDLSSTSSAASGFELNLNAPFNEDFGPMSSLFPPIPTSTHHQTGYDNGYGIGLNDYALAESNVDYALAQMNPYGFAAFDKSGDLIGIYQLDDDNEAIFKPVDLMKATLRQDSLDSFVKWLEESKRKFDECIRVPGHELLLNKNNLGTLKRLREQLVYLYVASSIDTSFIDCDSFLL